MTLHLACDPCRKLHPLASVADVAPEGGIRGRCESCQGETRPVLECDGCQRKVRKAAPGWRVRLTEDAVRHECSACGGPNA